MVDCVDPAEPPEDAHRESVDAAVHAVWAELSLGAGIAAAARRVKVSSDAAAHTQAAHEGWHRVRQAVVTAATSSAGSSAGEATAQPVARQEALRAWQQLASSVGVAGRVKAAAVQAGGVGEERARRAGELLQKEAKAEQQALDAAAAAAQVSLDVAAAAAGAAHNAAQGCWARLRQRLGHDKASRQAVRRAAAQRWGQVRGAVVAAATLAALQDSAAVQERLAGLDVRTEQMAAALIKASCLMR